MSNNTSVESFIEPERYELFENPAFGEVSRRQFFRIVGGGVVVALLLGDSAFGQRRGSRGGAAPKEIGAWLHIGEDGLVTVYTGKAEVGQNIRTSLTQVVAEELHTPVERIRLVMADTELTPFDMGTFGSRTTPDMASQLRRVAAAAREELIDLAAEAGEGRPGDADRQGRQGRRAGRQAFLRLRRADQGQEAHARRQRRGSDHARRQVDRRRRSVPKVDGRSFVTGAHQYASDVKRPGMLIGKVLRPPSFKATLVSVKTAAAEAMPGVMVVHDGDFVGVAAPSERQAAEALAAIQADWRETPQPSAKDLFKHLKDHAGGGGRGGRGGFGGGRTRAARSRMG